MTGTDGTCVLPLPNPNLRKPKLFPDTFFFLSLISKLRALKNPLILVYFIPSLCLHQVLTKTFPKLYSALSVNFSLFSLDCPFFLEKNMKLFWFSSWKFMLSNLTWFSLLLCTLFLCTLNLLEIPLWISYIVFFKKLFHIFGAHWASLSSEYSLASWPWEVQGHL